MFYYFIRQYTSLSDEEPTEDVFPSRAAAHLYSSILLGIHLNRALNKMIIPMPDIV